MSIALDVIVKAENPYLHFLVVLVWNRHFTGQFYVSNLFNYHLICNYTRGSLHCTVRTTTGDFLPFLGLFNGLIIRYLTSFSIHSLSGRTTTVSHNSGSSNLYSTRFPINLKTKPNLLFFVLLWLGARQHFLATSWTGQFNAHWYAILASVCHCMLSHSVYISLYSTALHVDSDQKIGPIARLPF